MVSKKLIFINKLLKNTPTIRKADKELNSEFQERQLSQMLSPREVSERVMSIVSEVLSLDEPPGLDLDLRKDLNADSLDLLTLFMTLEDEFGGSIPEDEVESISTVGDIIEYINGRIAAEQPES